MLPVSLNICENTAVNIKVEELVAFFRLVLKILILSQFK